ncbi:hypothetical protein IF1G_04461 [Cordyceps javanica]|uniref:Uncharacterized protein n=1 Tax=Cordyceps javanica TaxID=43265 RepID=A0A545V683_9HYPO|nr:hypothetical protein IF1G_04461 [Cordyceps javanica]
MLRVFQQSGQASDIFALSIAGFLHKPDSTANALTVPRHCVRGKYPSRARLIDMTSLWVQRRSKLCTRSQP